MENNKKKAYIAGGIAAALLILTLILPALVMGAENKSSGIIMEENRIAGGNVTDTVTWKITEDERGGRTLTISGNGPMKDYTNEAQQPWIDWRETIGKVIIEDGVTRIGNTSFYKIQATEVQIGKGVEAIGIGAFAYGRNLKSIVIPGNVKIIEKDAFVYHYALSHVVLEEGVEVLGVSALGSQADLGDELHIPASLKQFDQAAVWMATGYTVAEDNPYFSAVDGVLLNKDKTALVDYPKKRAAVEYQIPDYICEIKNGAFQYVRDTAKFVFPSSIQRIHSSQLFKWSDVEEVYVDDGVPFPCGSEFYGCRKLIRIRLPENIAIDKIDNIANGNCDSLESLKIPNGVKHIVRIGDPLKSMNHIIYDAEKATIKDDVQLDPLITYTLTVGENVDYLPKEFHWFSSQADTLLFQKPNTFTVEAEAFSNQSAPFNTLEGKIHIDEQGVMYRCEEEGKTAQIISYMDEFESVFIPGRIQCEDGEIYEVTSVGKDAFKNAATVKNITFEKPEQIQFIETYGFANCVSLMQINNCTSVEEAERLFSGAVNRIGYRAFYNTCLIAEEKDHVIDSLPGQESIVLKGEEGSSDLILSVDSDGNTMEWVTDDNGGKYCLLTGDTLTVLAAAGNKEASESQKYRVYFQRSSEECSLSIKAGESYSFDNQNVSCHETEDPNCIYIEFSPLIGKTLSIPVTAVYTSPDSQGGQLAIWSVSLKKTEAEEYENKIILPKAGVIRMEWKTQRDDFVLSLTEDGEKTITLLGSDKESIILDRNLRWKAVLMREEELVSSYGKDYIKYATYHETLTLPKGMFWKEEVVEAVKEGQIRRKGSSLYVGNDLLCNVSLYGGQLSLSGMQLIWDDDNKVMNLAYKVSNIAKDAEMNTNTLVSTFYMAAFDVNIDAYDSSVTNEIVDRVNADIHYQYSGKVSLSSTCQKTVKVNPGKTSLSKNTITKPYYFGEKIDYEIQLKNPGALPYFVENVGTWSLQETLSPYIYLDPEDMEKMFGEEAGKNLVIEILNTEYVEWESSQGVFEDTLYWKNSYNSGVNLQEYATETILIHYNEAGTSLEVEANGIVYEENTLEESLKHAGFEPGRWTEYHLCWDLNGADETFGLKAGETRKFFVYGKVKDTFRMLSEDWPVSYPTDAALALNSTVALVDHSGNPRHRAATNDSVVREVYIGKKAVVDGIEWEDSFTAEDGDVITYNLEITHYGNGSYKNLPMIDEMYGSQALMVPALENPNLEKEGLCIFEKDGKDYYILTEGSYSNVVVGGNMEGRNYIAAQIRVEPVDEERSVEYQEENHTYKGLYTRIEWNWNEVPSGRYRLSLSYDAIVKQEFSQSNVFSLGNLVWMNDRENSRIHAGIWGGGSIIDFRKEILERKGSVWEEDVIDEDGYTLVSTGDTVTYRMTLRNKGDGECEITGKDILDRLPDNGDVFSWVKDRNVTLFYESTHESTLVTGLEDWSIERDDEERNQQYITWKDTARIQLEEPDARVYIYVKLTYPDNQGQETDWNRYVQTMKGKLIENTFYVYEFPVNVTHHLNEPGQVLLQKGVYGTSYKKVEQYLETTGRRYYNNTDVSERQVIYYVFLHNAGVKRWYLNDIYDYMPEGFTFEKFINDSDLNKSGQDYSILTNTEFEDNPIIEVKQLYENQEEIHYKSAKIEWKAEETGGIRFQIGGGTGSQSVCYDEERGQYYLNQNEAILFGYMCNTGLLGETKDSAVNSIFMHYEDYPKTGLLSTENYPIRVHGICNHIYGDQNDGDCHLIEGTDIRNQFGISDGELYDQWIMSDVSILKGDIIPGITKYTESVTSAGSSLTTKYESGAGPFDQINWRVRLHNSGTCSMTDYVFEDMFPSPYVLGDKVRLEIYDHQGEQIKTYEIFQITEREEDSISVLVNNSKKVISIDGEEMPIYISHNKVGSVSISKTEQKNEILTIHFSSHSLSVPEGGYMDIYLSAYNPTNQYKNTVYTNQAVLIPQKQSFDSVSQGSMLRDEKGVPEGVKNYSPVTIRFGYSTASKKAVYEKEDSNNKALSTDVEHNKIILSGKNQIFTYELTVTNDTEKSMEKLIFIDNLPEKGDVSPFDSTVERQSQFKVGLTDGDSIKVMISVEEETYELDKNLYDISYSEKTVFTEEDWTGQSEWNGEWKDARAVRISINDNSGDVLPPKAKISVLFDCRILEEAKAGDTAWNSFGYHYKLHGVEQELEAMPMPVGVKTAGVPKLEKLLEDRNGNPYTASEDVEFNFLIYEGGEIKDSSLNFHTMTKEEWEELLKEKEMDYRIESVVVKGGRSESVPLLLEKMEWKHGRTYTVVELPGSDTYGLKSINGMENLSYTFVYDKEENQTITFVNEAKEWALELLKLDKEEKSCLEGAVFALYSSEKQDVSENLSEIEKEHQVAQEIEREGQTWYLHEAGITNSEGKIVWIHLKEDQYYLVEIEAPDGYQRQSEGQIVYGRNAENGIVSLKVTNERGQILPQTGGTGIGMFIAVGTVLMISSCLMRHDKKNLMKKKGESI